MPEMVRISPFEEFNLGNIARRQSDALFVFYALLRLW
jgi:hypothetical protein